MEIIEIIRDRSASLLASNNVAFAGVFGSVARGEDRPESDVDILVRFDSPKSLIDIIGLEEELSHALDRDVDLVTERSLCPHIRDEVFRDLKTLIEDIPALKKEIGNNTK